jgi:hypothetical protein
VVSDDVRLGSYHSLVYLDRSTADVGNVASLVDCPSLTNSNIHESRLAWNDNHRFMSQTSESNTNGATPDDDFGPQYWRDLVNYPQIAPKEPPVGDFGKLQIMNTTHLLNRLSIIKAKIAHNHTVDAQQMDLLRQTLHQYSNIPSAYTKVADTEHPYSGCNKRLPVSKFFERPPRLRTRKTHISRRSIPLPRNSIQRRSKPPIRHPLSNDGRKEIATSRSRPRSPAQTPPKPPFLDGRRKKSQETRVQRRRAPRTLFEVCGFCCEIRYWHAWGLRVDSANGDYGFGSIAEQKPGCRVYCSDSFRFGCRHGAQVR